LNELTKGNGIATNIDSHNRESETESGEEAASPCRWSPEAVQDCIEQIPLIPICLSKLSLHCCSGADTEEEDQCLTGEYRGRLTPSGVFRSPRVASKVRLLFESVRIYLDETIDRRGLYALTLTSRADVTPRQLLMPLSMPHPNALPCIWTSPRSWTPSPPP
jgi:hypothetical protein